MAQMVRNEPEGVKWSGGGDCYLLRSIVFLSFSLFSFSFAYGWSVFRSISLGVLTRRDFIMSDEKTRVIRYFEQEIRLY